MSKPANPELKRRILDLVLDELGEKPPERINMRDLAARAGVSATTIYYYFPSKGALFETIKFAAMEEADRRIAAAVEAASGAPDRIRALMRSFVGWCLERPHLARLLMETLPAREDLDAEAMRRYYSIYLRARDIVAEGVAEGTIAPRDLDLDLSVTQSALWGILSHYWSKRVHPRFWDSPDQLVERLATLFIGAKGATP